MGDKKRGGIETTRLVTLDTADHQQCITRPVRSKFVEGEIHVVVRHGRSGENKQATQEYAKKPFHAFELTLICQGSKRTPAYCPRRSEY